MAGVRQEGRKAFSRGRAQVLLVVVSVLLMSLGGGPAVWAGGLPRPTPAAYDQWEPEKGVSDARLERTVSVELPEVRVEDLLADLTKQAGVQVGMAGDLADARVSIYARDRVLAGVLLDLATLFEGAWYYRRDEAPAARAWVFAGRRGMGDFSDRTLVEQMRQSQLVHCAAHRAEWSQRLSEYEAALALSQAEVLKFYEASDPWLCSTLLDPTLRPVVEYVATMSSDDRDRLLREGRLQLPLTSVDEGLRRHLAEWANGRWGYNMAMRYPSSNLDELPRFSTPEERWRNASVEFIWKTMGLQVALHVPDMGLFADDCIILPNHPPRSIRGKLRDYRLMSPAEGSQGPTEAEQQVWRDRLAAAKEASEKEASRLDSSMAPPDRSSRHLATQVKFTQSGNKPLSLGEFLGQVAEQCGISVTADFLPREALAIPVSESEQQGRTLGEWLETLYGKHRGRFTWVFRGDALIVTHADANQVQAGLLSDEAIAAWQARVKRGRAIPLDELAAAVAELSLAQTWTLDSLFSVLTHLRLDRLRFYGLLSKSQHNAMASPKGLSFNRLDATQQFALLEIAQEERRWVTEGDLRSAVLRTIRRQLTTGDAGISVVVDYHFRNSSSDRDVVLTSPLLITFPVTGSAT